MVNIRQPRITGKTLPEQINQIIAYLRQLAQDLQACSQPAMQAPEQSTQRGSVFADLRVRKGLTVDGGVNGVFTRQVRVWESTSFSLQSKFSQWDTLGHSRQSFLVCGNGNNLPVLGVVALKSNGEALWQGSEGVSVSTEAGGVVKVTLSRVAYDYFLVQSAEHFSVK